MATANKKTSPAVKKTDTVMVEVAKGFLDREALRTAVSKVKATRNIGDKLEVSRNRAKVLVAGGYAKIVEDVSNENV